MIEINYKGQTYSIAFDTYVTDNTLALLLVAEDGDWFSVSEHGASGEYCLIDTKQFPDLDNVLVDAGLAERSGEREIGAHTYPLLYLGQTLEDWLEESFCDLSTEDKEEMFNLHCSHRWGYEGIYDFEEECEERWSKMETSEKINLLNEILNNRLI